MTFDLIDVSTGKTVSPEVINKLAKEGVLEADNIDQFLVGENGNVYLLDNNGNIMLCDKSQFVVKRTDTRYPDIPYLEKLLLANIYAQNPELKSSTLSYTASADMFQQVWPNTAGGFSKPGYLAGQAITEQYTTIIKIQLLTNVKKWKTLEFYGVFFDNVPAYMVTDANDRFYEDLNNRNMASQYKSREIY